MAVSNLCSQVSQRNSFKKITWTTHVFWSQVIHWSIISLFTYYFWILICNIFCEHIFSLEALSTSLPKAAPPTPKKKTESTSNGFSYKEIPICTKVILRICYLKLLYLLFFFKSKALSFISQLTKELRCKTFSHPITKTNYSISCKRRFI